MVDHNCFFVVIRNEKFTRNEVTKERQNIAYTRMSIKKILLVIEKSGKIFYQIFKNCMTRPYVIFIARLI